jgi:two-component system, cell cycle sensor histidine kinase and response regulator CckA
VRAQVVRVLRGAGYLVIEAADGAQAVAAFQTAKGAIDLVLLDAVMPVCNGWQAYVEMARLKPGIKALFTTGYAANVLPADFLSQGARLLSKPFKPAELLAKVRELLTSSAGSQPA